MRTISYALQACQNNSTEQNRTLEHLTSENEQPASSSHFYSKGCLVISLILNEEGWLERDSMIKAGRLRSRPASGHALVMDIYLRSFELENSVNGQMQYEQGTFANVRPHEIRTAETKACKKLCFSRRGNTATTNNVTTTNTW